MKNIMLDLETLDTQQSAVIVSIGAFAFDLDVDTVRHAFMGDPATFKERGKTFYCELKLDEQTRKGRSICGHTVQWWMEQSKEAQSAVTNKDRLSVVDALAQFTRFLREQGKCVVWGNGSDFDNVILGSLYHSFEIERPWPYSANRCFRTMKAACPIQKPERLGTHHNGLDDAVYQTLWLCRMVNKYPRLLGYANDGAVAVPS